MLNLLDIHIQLLHIKNSVAIVLFSQLKTIKYFINSLRSPKKLKLIKNRLKRNMKIKWRDVSHGSNLIVLTQRQVKRFSNKYCSRFKC